MRYGEAVGMAAALNATVKKLDRFSVQTEDSGEWVLFDKATHELWFPEKAAARFPVEWPRIERVSKLCSVLAGEVSVGSGT
jgi:hypothetical protein